MADIGDIARRLKERLKRMTPEEKEAEFESITHTKFWNRWCEKFHKLTKEQRFEFVNKAIRKYSSNEYKRKEYNLGYEPREELYQLFAHYAEKYGKYLKDEKYYTSFVGDAMVFDNTWVIQILYGQGAVIHINHVNKFNE